MVCIFNIDTNYVTSSMRKAFSIFLAQGNVLLIHTISTGGLNGRHPGIALDGVEPILLPL
ncbi:hypothetical protein ACWKSJ_13850 (plasmid) [Staphylococcus equorum]